MSEAYGVGEIEVRTYGTGLACLDIALHDGPLIQQMAGVQSPKGLREWELARWVEGTGFSRMTPDQAITRAHALLAAAKWAKEYQLPTEAA